MGSQVTPQQLPLFLFLAGRTMQSDWYMMASRLMATASGYHCDWGLEGVCHLAGDARSLWTAPGASLTNQLIDPN